MNMKKIILLLALFFHCTLSAGLPTDHRFAGPTQQLIKRESWERIEKKLEKMDIPSYLFPYFDEIAHDEDWGHLGYHGANQGFRIFQDIIGMVVGEILQIQLPENFYFLRIPGESTYNLNSIDEFYDFWGKLDNKKERGKQLLSLNFGIYSNFDVPGSCSISLFVKDKSKTEINYAKELVPFFEKLGIASEEAGELFNIGRKWLDEDGGILLQISDKSHLLSAEGEAYCFADTNGYPAKRGGHRYGDSPLSNHFEKIMSDLYVAEKVDIAPQLRLLIDNRHALNPFSFLEIKRWDLYDRATIKSYEDEMRDYVKKLACDQAKVDFYRQVLMKMWLKGKEIP
jgi:hypothetical protein